jgi:rhamnosyltransferase
MRHDSTPLNRVLFFVHYNKYDGLCDHVLYLLENIKHIYKHIVFISNSPLKTESENKIAQLSNTVIIRENKGYDFGAWKDAILGGGGGG